MRTSRLFDRRLVLTVVGFVCLFSVSSAQAKDPPSDLCSLLTPAQLEKSLGQPFSESGKSAAPAPYAGQPKGTNCQYSSQKGASMAVGFIVYVDASAAQAQQNFDKSSMWYAPKSRPTAGDSAYIDAKGAIHVLKGRVQHE